MLQIMTVQQMSRAFLGFGGNMGDTEDLFRQARQQLANHPQIRVKGGSPLYQTPAIGGPSGQPDYINAVLAIETSLSEFALLTFCQQLEQDGGRVRTVRWGPRTLDIDLLLFADHVCASEILTLPHPRLHQRHFVLLPLCDLAPDWIHPVYQKSIARLLTELGPEHGISKLKQTW